MAGSDVIGDVSAALQSLLNDAMSTLTPLPSPVAEVHDLQGTIPTAPALLTIFLYEVGEDPSLRNRPLLRDPDPGGFAVRKPPMALLLRYLVTPWGGDRITEQRMLGRVLQVLYDRPVLSGPQLGGSLAASTDAVKITLAPLSLEERSRIWHAVQKPYRMSLTYELRVVNLDAEIDTVVPPVSSRVLDMAVP